MVSSVAGTVIQSVHSLSIDWAGNGTVVSSVAGTVIQSVHSLSIDWAGNGTVVSSVAGTVALSIDLAGKGTVISSVVGFKHATSSSSVQCLNHSATASISWKASIHVRKAPFAVDLLPWVTSAAESQTKFNQFTCSIIS